MTISCIPSDVTILGTSQCTATVVNLSSNLVNWAVTTGTGSINSGGLYTAPASVPTNNVITITATSQVQSTLTATQNLTIQQPTAISAVTCVNSNSVSASVVSSGNKLSCTATTSTGATVPVYWSVSSTLGGSIGIGSISAQGNYSAPLVPPPGQMVTITATSQALATETMSVTVQVVFGNNVLSGPFAFSTSGRLPTNVFWARAGSFTVGGGAVTGIEDTNQGGAPNTVHTQISFTGSYSIGPDGRGVMQFCEDSSSDCPQGSPATAYFSIVVISPSQAQIVEFSAPSLTAATITAGGEMVSQSSLNFGAGDGNLSGTYSFDFSGVSSSAAEESAAGEFAADGFGTISLGSSVAPGEMDINAGGTLSNVSLPASTYSINANGRGTVTLNGLQFSFYPVSSNRAKFIEIDTAPASILLGDAYKQQTSATCGWGLNALSGSIVFDTSGANAGVAIADVGSFTADGTTGAVSAASVDQNSGGTVSSAVGTLTGSYAMDACGRGTLTVGTHSYIFYIISSSNAVLLEKTSGVVAHGVLVPSPSGSFVDKTLTGSYAFRFAGTDKAGTAGNREDFLGQMTSAGSGKGVSGTADINDFGATQSGVAIATGMYSADLVNKLRVTMSLPLNTKPAATTRNLVLYMVSPTQFFALDTDASPAGTALGTIDNQF